MLHWWGLLSRFTFEVSQGTLLIWWAVCLVSVCTETFAARMRSLLDGGEPSSHSVHPPLRSPLSLEHCVSQTIWRWAFRYLFHLWHSCVCVCACVHGVRTTVWRGQIPFSNLCLSCLWRQGLSLAWSSPVYVFWLAREPQGPATFHLLSTGVQVGTTVFKTFTWAVGLELRFSCWQDKHLTDWAIAPTQQFLVIIC